VPTRLATVAIVGRPNVGKSTLFNRFLGRRRAVVDALPGVTRDRNVAEVVWNRRVFSVIDTGGYVPRPGERLAESVSHQVEMALGEADVILLVVDARTTPTDYDGEMARVIRGTGKPCLLVANKVDSEQDQADATDYYRLGLGDPVCVSALNGRLSGDLLDEVVSRLPAGEEQEVDAEPVPRLAVVGRPNVGKSTLINRLLGQERLVVSPIPGTTRDAIDLPMRRDGREFVLIDTAGLRRRARVTEQVEYYSAVRTNESLERCDAAIVLVDAVEGCTVQDVKIVDRALELGKAVVIAVNKWDLVEKDTKTASAHTREILDRFPFLGYYPISFVSALSGQRTWRILDLALDAYDRRSSRVTTGELNAFLQQLNATSAPVSSGGQAVRMTYVVQPKSSPPTFVFFTSRPKEVPEHYRRFLERRLREQFDFLGTPVRLAFRGKKRGPRPVRARERQT